MNAAWPFWNAKRVCSSCHVSAAGGTMPSTSIASRINVSASHRALGVDDHAPAVVEDASAERAEVLEEDRHQPFVARALPHQAERHGCRGHRASRQLRQLVEIASARAA